jgi:hypothetical protein
MCGVWDTRLLMGFASWHVWKPAASFADAPPSSLTTVVINHATALKADGKLTPTSPALNVTNIPTPTTAAFVEV